MRNKVFKAAGWVLLSVFLLAAIWWLKPLGQTVDFAGVVRAVSVEDGAVYVTAVQEMSEFTVEIAIPANARAKSGNGKLRAAEIRVGDGIMLNFRKKAQNSNGVWRATAKGTITVWPQMEKPG